MGSLLFYLLLYFVIFLGLKRVKLLIYFKSQLIKNLSFRFIYAAHYHAKAIQSLAQNDITVDNKHE